MTREEKEYIVNSAVLKAASIDGGAPLHYRDFQGEIRGIAVQVLDEIAERTGLVFEYYLYDSIEEAFKSGADIYFGVTRHYASPDMVLSEPYLKSETILFFNSRADSNNLGDKTYAAIKGGTLPEGVNAENTLYFNNREETMAAVEKGKADYGYGNAYSVAFYILQNGYKNIVTIPRGKETREYCMAFSEENSILLSIINKSIAGITENQMQTLILDVASKVDRKVTFPAVIDAYGREILGLASLVVGILLIITLSNVRANRQLKLQNRRYELLSHISNEFLFEYHPESDRLKLSRKIRKEMGSGDKARQLGSLLKDKLLAENKGEQDRIIKITSGEGEAGAYRIIFSNIEDDQGKIHSFIGKLIDVSEEMAEKEELLTMSQLDGLTGLCNALTTRKLIGKSLKNKDLHKKDALIIIDCDNFKQINDTFGHLKGDEVLKNISRELKLAFRQSDILGRIGGDEFLVYIRNTPSIDFIRSKCRQLITTIDKTDESVRVSISMGIAILGNESTYEELFMKADKALYAAKRKGGAGIVFYGEPC